MHQHAANPDPLAFLADADPGTVLYGFAADGGDLHIELLIRETSAEIARIPAAPEIQIRAGFREIGTVFVVVVMFRMESGGPAYLSLWNYHAPVADAADGNLFHHLAGEAGGELILKLVGDTGKVERLIPLRHPLRTFFGQAIRRIERLSPWDDAAFRSALEVLFEEHSNVEELWASLQA
jgi:hypothetical protein